MAARSTTGKFRRAAGDITFVLYAVTREIGAAFVVRDGIRAICNPCSAATAALSRGRNEQIDTAAATATERDRQVSNSPNNLGRRMREINSPQNSDRWEQNHARTMALLLSTGRCR